MRHSGATAQVGSSRGARQVVITILASAVEARSSGRAFRRPTRPLKLLAGKFQPRSAAWHKTQSGPRQHTLRMVVKSLPPQEHIIPAGGVRYTNDDCQQHGDSA